MNEFKEEFPNLFEVLQKTVDHCNAKLLSPLWADILKGLKNEIEDGRDALEELEMDEIARKQGEVLALRKLENLFIYVYTLLERKID